MYPLRRLFNIGRCIVVGVVFTLCTQSADANIPVEVFLGNHNATIDIMFFTFFKNDSGENTPWLFFNRNRASIDYRIADGTFLPQFGFTEAISYNHEAFAGFAPVVVTQVLSSGVYPKGGIQYANVGKEIIVFTWLITELQQNPTVDYFLLLRYLPKLSNWLQGFVQLESINAFPTTFGTRSFTQRLRLGAYIRGFQIGFGADLTNVGRESLTMNHNVGGFIRYEF